MKINFIKMQGLGNDFIVIEKYYEKYLSSKIIQFLCDRNKGIGCDQLIVVEEKNNTSIKIDIYNPDSSKAGACGNAFRALGKHYIKKLQVDHLNIYVKERLFKVIIEEDGNPKVNMGLPLFGFDQIPIDKNLSPSKDPQKLILDGINLKGFISPFALSFGNTHLVLIKNTPILDEDLALGKKIEHHKIFPDKTNVEFAYILDDSNIKMRVWEKSTGETLACGSGACATFVASYKRNLIGKKANVHMKGGVLEISINIDGTINMKGDAKTVFTGTIDIKNAR